MPIRWRLTLWFSLILCVTLILSGIVIHTQLESSLSRDIDENLQIYSSQVHNTINPQEIPEPLDYEVMCSCLPPIDEFSSPGIYIQVIDKNGSIIAKSDSLGEQHLPIDQDLMEYGFEGNAGIKTISTSDGAKVRVMASPLYLWNRTLLLEVGQSLTHINTMMSQVRWAILAGIVLALALAVISGSILVRQALSPVEDITRTAQNIESSSDLSQKVGYKGPMDEIGYLATTFDHMIEHLDKAFESQKHFVADASHELRTPLTILQGNLDMMKRNLGEEDRRESIKTMGAQIERMSDIVNDLLLLAEVESGQVRHKQSVSLKEVLIEGLERGQQLGENRKIIIGRQENLSVEGDSLRLKQLLGNLIDNAIKHTPNEGTITLSLFRDGEWACLEVADTGSGIDSEHLPHIFDRFYRINKVQSRAMGGTGIGLAIVKAITDQHGGKLIVTSEIDKGSTFTVWLRLTANSV